MAEDTKDKPATPINTEHQKGTGPHPSAEEIAALVKSSGYLLEGRIARVFNSHCPTAQTNVLHKHPIEPNRLVEIDVEDHYSEWFEPNSYLRRSVLVECKNNSQPVAFFTRSCEAAYNIYRITYTGFPRLVEVSGHNLIVPHRLMAERWHHYCLTKEVAAQLCTFKRSKSWELDNDKPNHYRSSMSDLCLIAATGTQPRPSHLTARGVELEIAYPVMVFQGPIYTVREEFEPGPFRITGRREVVVEPAAHVQFQHTIRLADREINMQVDIVTETEFPRLLNSIEAERQKFVSGVREHYDVFMQAAASEKQQILRCSPYSQPPAPE
jgi:hypothetical protein